MLAGLLAVGAPGSDAAATATGTFGRTSVGTLVDTGGANFLDSSGPYSVSSSVSLTKLTTYVAGSASSSRVRGVVYADDGTGKPGAFVAVTSETTIAAGRAPGWLDLPFPSPVSLPAASYWLGYWYADSNGRYSYASVAGSERYVRATYSASANPPASYGSASASSSSYSLYATYTTGSPPPPPVNTAPPTISGTAQQGQTLTATTGSWTNSPTAYAYGWQDCDGSGAACAPIAGASAPTYLLAASDVGHTVRVAVTASNAGGSSTPASSAATAAVTASSGPALYDWPTFGGDNLRRSYNTSESTIGTGNVASLGKLWSFSLGAVAIGTPVVASGVSVGGATHNIVYIGTEHGDLDAVDLDTGQLLWRRNLGSHTATGCNDTPDSVFGVSGTPVIDRSSSTIYAVGGGTEKLYALDLATGADASGWPVSLGLDGTHEHVWGALTLAGGKIYAGSASFCDVGPYYGRIVQVDVATRATATWYTTSPRGGTPDGGGIWSWAGASVDPSTGDLFLATGNAIDGAESYGYGEHVVRLSSSLSVVGSNYPGLTGFDVDFGSTPIPVQRSGCPAQLVVENKSGVVLLYGSDSISSGPVQTIQLSNYVSGGELIGVPAVSPASNTVYVASPTDVTGGPYTHGLVAFQVGSDCKLHLLWQHSAGTNGSVVSSPTIANGVVYYGDGPGKQVLAYAADTGTPLWNSGTTVGGMIFAPPVVADGKLIVGAWDGQLYAFGLGAPPAVP